MTYQLLTAGLLAVRLYLNEERTEWLDIPPDLANNDYVEYLAWVEAGNTPEPAPTV